MEDFLELTGWKPKVAKSLEENSLLRTILEQKQQSGEQIKPGIQRRHPVKTIQRSQSTDSALHTDVKQEVEPAVFNQIVEQTTEQLTEQLAEQPVETLEPTTDDKVEEFDTDTSKTVPTDIVEETK